MSDRDGSAGVPPPAVSEKIFDSSCKHWSDSNGAARRRPDSRRDAGATGLVDVLALFPESYFRRRQLVARTRPQHVQSGQQDNADEQFDDQATDNHNRKWTLRVGADVV